jgi:catechol 2,3-dioxygenase-like lactoylglutathione lyase family enzyme
MEQNRNSLSGKPEGFDSQLLGEAARFAASIGFEAVPVRRRRDGWTLERQLVYLAMLAAGAGPREAAARVGMTTQGVGKLLRRADAAAFAAACAAAWRIGEPRRRALAAGRRQRARAGAYRAEVFSSLGSRTFEPCETSAAPLAGRGRGSTGTTAGCRPPASGLGPATRAGRPGAAALPGASAKAAKESAMLKDHDSSAILAVADLARARAFYSETLGLELAWEGEAEGVLVYRTGATRLIVYRSEFAGTNRSNAIVWGVGGDLDPIVASLEAKGASFEHYPDIGRLEGNVHHAGGMKLVWLRDPDGNILHLNSARRPDGERDSS